MKTAIIIGYTGQDGQLLFDLLEAQGYSVIGIGRNDIAATHPTLLKADDMPGVIDICNTQHVFELLKHIQPDEVYHLAAHHHSSQDTIQDAVALFEQSYHVNVLSLSNILEGIRLHSPQTRLFYAASSHIFGHSATDRQTEETPLSPHTIYGIHKSSGLLLCQMYRKNYSVFASVGILYNHESSLRPEKFVSRKIIKAAANIKRGKQDYLELGDVQAVIDWGYAPDFVRAMWQMLQLEEPTECIIATGKRHTVQDFLQCAFDELELPWAKYVRVNPAIITRNPTVLVGDSSKLERLTGWKPSVSFEEMVKILVSNELKQENRRL
jgi:GDPmannose 4,6-dehydratase